MRPSDRSEFVRILTGMAAIKPGGKLTPEAIDLYWNAMQSWAIEEFRAAASHLVQTCEFMPNPYHFTKLRKAGELTAGEAWDLVKSGAVLEPGSRAYRAAQIVGGQYYIRHADVERDLPFIERRFLQAFADLEKVDPVREALPQIVKPEVRIALRGPAHASHFIPDFRQRADGDDT